MSSLSIVEKRIFEDLFGMSTGYVLGDDLTNATFAGLFRDNVGIDIDADEYAFNGTSKAKRLRAFWEVQSDLLVGKILTELLEIWNYKNPSPDKQTQACYEKALSIANRLQGKAIVVEDTEDTFLRQQFSKLDVSKIGLEESLITVIQVQES